MHLLFTSFTNMNINIKTKDLELTDAIESYLAKKLESLGKFMKSFNQEAIIADVELGKTTRDQRTGDIFRAEINLEIGGELLRAEAETESIYASIDEVRDQIEEEIKKFKEKKDTLFKRGARSIKKMLNLSPMARFREPRE